MFQHIKHLLKIDPMKTLLIHPPKLCIFLVLTNPIFLLTLCTKVDRETILDIREYRVLFVQQLKHLLKSDPMKILPLCPQ